MGSPTLGWLRYVVLLPTLFKMNNIQWGIYEIGEGPHGVAQTMVDHVGMGIFCKLLGDGDRSFQCWIIRQMK